MTRTSPGELGEGKDEFGGVEGKDELLEFGECEDEAGGGMAGREDVGKGDDEAGGVSGGSIAQQTAGAAKEDADVEEVELASGKKEAKDGLAVFISNRLYNESGSASFFVGCRGVDFNWPDFV